MARVDLRRVFIMVSALALTMIYAASWLGMIGDPVLRTGSDFIAFHAAGRILETHGPARVYDLRLQQQAESEVLGRPIEQTDVFPFVHPAFIFPLLKLTIDEDYSASFVRWAAVMLILFTAAGLVLARWGFEPPEKGLTGLAVTGAVLFFPAFISLANGQDTAILVLGCALWAYGLSTERDWPAGLGLGLAVIRPHLALVLALPFLFQRRRVWWGFFTAASALAIFSVILLGPDGTLNYLRILAVSGSGQGYHTNEAGMVNLIGLLTRTAAWLPEVWIRATGWIAYALSIIWLCWLWRRSSDLSEKHIGLAVLVSLFAAPHLHYHDTALLLIPIFGLARILVQNGQMKSTHAALLPLIVSLVLVFTYNPTLQYVGLHLVMLLAGLWLWYPRDLERFIRNRLPVRPSKPIS